MKTPEQIKAWLEAQPWYELFKSYTLDEDANPHTDVDGFKYDSEKTLSGIRGDSTIVSAFVWRRTNEGYDFWNNVNNQFYEWYDK